MVVLASILVVALVASNVAWLIFLSKENNLNRAKEDHLLNRINVLMNKPPMPAYSRDANGKAPNEVKPRELAETLVDPEWEAVGKIDPSFINRMPKDNG